LELASDNLNAFLSHPTVTLRATLLGANRDQYLIAPLMLQRISVDSHRQQT
jgi:hypothetical protein